MFNSFRFKHVIVLTSILSFLILAFFLTSVILEQEYVILLPYNLDFTLLGVAIVFILIGFVLGDIKKNRYRKEKKQWVEPLPLAIKQEVWNLRMPWYTSGVLGVFLTLIYTLIWKM